MARKNKNGLIIQQVRKISAEKWRAKGMEIFILFSGGQGGLCKVNRGPQAAATRRVQKFSKQKSRRLRNAWDGVERILTLIFCLGDGFWN